MPPIGGNIEALAGAQCDLKAFDFAKIGLKGKFKLHDVWRQKDLGSFNGTFTTDIRHHGVVMLRMKPL